MCSTRNCFAVPVVVQGLSFDLWSLGWTGILLFPAWRGMVFWHSAVHIRRYFETSTSGSVVGLIGRAISWVKKHYGSGGFVVLPQSRCIVEFYLEQRESSNSLPTSYLPVALPNIMISCPSPHATPVHSFLIPKTIGTTNPPSQTHIRGHCSIRPLKGVFTSSSMWSARRNCCLPRLCLYVAITRTYPECVVRR